MKVKKLPYKKNKKSKNCIIRKEKSMKLKLAFMSWPPIKETFKGMNKN